MRGRKPEELTKEKIIIREKSKKRITDFVNECKRSKLSLIEIADKIGITEGSLRNYQTGRNYISVPTAELFEKSTGFICEYWLGLADEHITVAEREEELAARYPDEWNTVEDKSEEIAKERTTIAFFEQCGFRYKNLLLHPTAYEFSGLSGDCFCAPHRIENVKRSAECYFTEEELSDLFSKVHDLIELECFKKQKAK